VDKVASAIAFTARLAACRAALHAAARELQLAGGPGAAACLAQVFDSLLAVWSRLKELDAARAEEEAQEFKTKARSSSFLNEEVRGRNWCGPVGLCLAVVHDACAAPCA
jgi:hypothetical protein